LTPLSNKLRHRQPLEPPRLNLTAMVDVFVVLLIFLLKSYSAEGNIMTTNKSLELPVSTSTLQPQLTLTLTVTKEAIFVEDKRVEEVRTIQEGSELFIPSLAQELKYQVERARFVEVERLPGSARGAGGYGSTASSPGKSSTSPRNADRSAIVGPSTPG